jgi:hypothetical protein
MDRKQILMGGVSAGSRVIEIGPSFSPLAPKRDGWDVTIVDHADRDGLICKYANEPGLDTSSIEDVDLVWHGGSISDLAGPEAWGTYDVFVASHVMEHSTDLIRFLQSARKLLKDDGSPFWHCLTSGNASTYFDCSRRQETRWSLMGKNGNVITQKLTLTVQSIQPIAMANLAGISPSKVRLSWLRRWTGRLQSWSELNWKAT